MYVMKYLIQAIQSQEMRNIIQSYSSTLQGYHQAIQTLKIRYGDEERLKVEKMEEVERFSFDCKTSIGLFKLSALINSIVSNVAFRGEGHRGSLLYQKFLSKLTYGNQSTYALQVPKDRQDLNTLKEFVRLLAENAMEQEKRRMTHSHGVKKESSHSQRPAYNYKAKHYSSKTSEGDNRNQQGKTACCDVCKGPHFVFYCLKDKPQEEVESIAREKRLCYNCLSSKHGIRDCLSKIRCRKCNGKHNTLFHKERLARRDSSAIQNKTEANDIKIENYAINQGRHSKVEKLLPVKFSAFVVPAYVKNIDTG